MLALVCCLAVPLRSAPLVSDDFDESIDRGLSLLYRGDYEAASAVFDSFITAHPQNPAGWFFKAGLYQVMMTDFESAAWTKQYGQNLDSALAISGRAVARNPKDAWAHFIRGGTYGYLTTRDGRSGSYMAALSHGLSALSDFKRAAALDPNLYDSYLGIGSYHYFRTRAVSILKWLPFIGDARDQGIEEIALAVQKGRYSGVMARNGLVWIYIDYNKHDRALALARGLEEEFPANPFFFWARPEVYWRTKSWAESAESYRRLLSLIESRPVYSNYNRVLIKYRLAKSLLELGRPSQAAQVAQEALNIPSDKVMLKKLVYERRLCREIIQQSKKKLKQ